MSEIEAIEKLRMAAKGDFENSKRYVTSNLEMLFGVEGTSDVMLAIADAIEAEIAERYMLLPVDADGVPIHVGDKVVNQLVDNQKLRVVAISNDDAYYYRAATLTYDRATNLKHVKPDLLKELLEEFANELCDFHVSDETFNHYAERIRELLGGDTE